MKNAVCCCHAVEKSEHLFEHLRAATEEGCELLRQASSAVLGVFGAVEDLDGGLPLSIIKLHSVFNELVYYLDFFSGYHAICFGELTE